MDEIIELNTIKDYIFTIRGKRVMIDRDLAELYGVETKKLNQAVKRNIERFPIDFMFQLTNEEQNELVTICDRFKNLKHSSSNAYAFTEHGVTMLSSILKSKKAIEINIQLVRAFIVLRQYAIGHNNLTQQIQDLQNYFINYCKENEADKQEIYRAIDLLMDRTKPTKIGFNTTKDN
jgi:phage regulator Rha-like protein